MSFTRSIDSIHPDEPVSSAVEEHNGVLITQKPRPERVAGRHCIHICKAVLAHIGLALILVAYVIGGGYMFRALELSNEYSDCTQRQHNYRKILNFSTARVMALTESQIDGGTDDGQVSDAMVEFARQVFSLDFHPDANCSAIIHTNFGARWNVGNAMYFCVTIITTIGYGHIVPATFWGKLSCIVYSTLGIPLMLTYLTIIGNGLAIGFRFVYLNVICCRCFYDMLRLRRLKRKIRLRQWEQALQQHEEEEARLKGLPVPPPKMQPVVIDYDEEVDEESEQSEELAVPLIVSVIVLTAYIAIGGLIFPLWEEWSFADSAYFSFITLSTIGLGDLVLGAGRLHETRTTYELAIGAFYMLFGLALLSMCLNLLQYEMLAKFRHMLQYFTLCGRDKGTHGADRESDLREEEETALAVLRASRAVEKLTEPVSQKEPANGEGSSEIHKRATSSFENNAFESE